MSNTNLDERLRATAPAFDQHVPAIEQELHTVARAAEQQAARGGHGLGRRGMLVIAAATLLVGGASAAAAVPILQEQVVHNPASADATGTVVVSPKQSCFITINASGGKRAMHLEAAAFLQTVDIDAISMVDAEAWAVQHPSGADPADTSADAKGSLVFHYVVGQMVQHLEAEGFRNPDIAATSSINCVRTSS
ncbi:MAG: hypothetical protein JWQ43_4142 [Glaciihabitans sp.]|nr:hypothetical protein [Glaciihabitans sp.]